MDNVQEITVQTDSDSVLNSLVREYKSRQGNVLNGRSDFLRRKRSEAVETLLKIGAPTGKEEEWKYTDVQALLSKPLVPVLGGKSDIDLSKVLAPGWDDDVAVLVNGEFRPELSRLGDKYTATSLQAAAESDDELFSEVFDAHTSDSSFFVSLNLAFASKGLFLHVPKGENVRLNVVNVVDGLAGATLVQPRILIVAEENSHLAVLETRQDVDHQITLTNAVTEIHAGRHAVVEYSQLQDFGNSSLVGNTFIYQKSSSHVKANAATITGGIIRNNTYVLSDGEHCESHLNGVVVGTENMHVDNHTFVDHARPDSFSNELYKTIVADDATGVFNGKVMVRQDSQRTNAYQSNKSIVIGDSARMYSKPELEIYADDVKCSHGATTGQLDDEAIFYLRSRGLTSDQARAMMLRAFVGDVLESIDCEPCQNYVTTAVEAALEKVG